MTVLERIREALREYDDAKAQMDEAGAGCGEAVRYVNALGAIQDASDLALPHLIAVADALADIAEWKALDDLSDELEADKDRVFGDHSFTWLTLAEILAYDWTQTAEGVNGPTTYAELAGTFWTQTVPWLLRQHTDPARVRIVFGFDN